MWSNSSPWQRNVLLTDTEELRAITQAVSSVSEELAVIINDVRINYFWDNIISLIFFLSSYTVALWNMSYKWEQLFVTARWTLGPHTSLLSCCFLQTYYLYVLTRNASNTPFFPHPSLLVLCFSLTSLSSVSFPPSPVLQSSIQLLVFCLLKTAERRPEKVLKYFPASCAVTRRTEASASHRSTGMKKTASSLF